MSPRLSPEAKPSENSATVSAKVTPELKRKIELIVLNRRIENSALPPRWGVSDYVREIIEDYFRRNPDG
jgi:hypothetical protein